MSLLAVHNLKMYYPVHAGVLKRKVADVKAVDGVSFQIEKGKTYGLVGESGCGKSTLGKCLVRLLKPTAGSILYDGKELVGLSEAELRPLRSQIQMVFQDPGESLNSRMSVEELISEPLIIHKKLSTTERQKSVKLLLDQVGLPNSALNRYPFEFSGGQRQRIGIARALAVDPSLIILDEPVSALDVSVQAQVLNLLNDLQAERKLSYLFISHDLSVVRHISDRVAVMYLGKLVEDAQCEALYEQPLHAYTKALLSAIPTPDPRETVQRTILKGDVPTPRNPPQGSAFGYRIGHPDYEKTIGMDLTPIEHSAGHWVAPDPCCVGTSILDSQKATAK